MFYKKKGVEGMIPYQGVNNYFYIKSLRYDKIKEVKH